MTFRFQSLERRRRQHKTVNVYGRGCKRCEATETMVKDVASPLSIEVAASLEYTQGGREGFDFHCGDAPETRDRYHPR